MEYISTTFKERTTKKWNEQLFKVIKRGAAFSWYNDTILKMSHLSRLPLRAIKEALKPLCSQQEASTAAIWPENSFTFTFLPYFRRNCRRQCIPITHSRSYGDTQRHTEMFTRPLQDANGEISSLRPWCIAIVVRTPPVSKLNVSRSRKPSQLGCLGLLVYRPLKIACQERINNPGRWVSF